MSKRPNPTAPELTGPNLKGDDVARPMSEFTAAVVGWCSRNAWLVIALAILAGSGFGWVSVNRLSIDTDTDRLLSEKLPWRQREIAFDKEFPQNSDLIAVVVNGSTPEQAESATAALTGKLKESPLFTSVVRPDGGPFFDRNGLLLLPVAEVQNLADSMIKAQGLIGNIAADPSLRGLANTLSLFLEGVKRGDARRSDIAPALTAISGAIEDNLDPAKPLRPLSWQSMLTGRKPSPTDLQRFIQAKPVLDFSSLTPGKAATDFIRKTAADLGLAPANGVTIKLTGDVPLNDEQFATVSQGLGVSMVVAMTLVALLLYGALRSVRMALAILATLVIGLLATAAFAALAVGTLNLISVAFAILFVGIAVDFGIQFSVRYRTQRHRIDDFRKALDATAHLVGPALILAALAASSGFFSFLPTAYRGVSELGIIAGVGMMIAVFFNLTVLPALMTVMRLGPEPRPVGFSVLAGLDDFLLRRRRLVLGITAVLGVGTIVLLPRLNFDFNPLNLMDPHTEAVSVMLELMKNPDTTPNTIDILAPTLDEAGKLADRLAKLPEVSRAVSLLSYIPEDQPEKLEILHDTASLIGPTLDPPDIQPPPDAAAMRSTILKSATALRAVVPAGEKDAPEQRLASLFEKVAASSDAMLDRIQNVLLSGLTNQLRQLRLVLSATPVTMADLPPDLVRSWVAPDGKARVVVFPAGDANNNDVLRRFVAAVRTIAPDATGTPVSIQESSHTIVNAFLTAGILATLGITILLTLTLRRFYDVLVALVPLLLAALFTLATTVIIGMPLNFANIIALPLLLGIGVAFDIYFVMNWRAGRPNPLQSGTARAIVFSTLTTASAFGSLILSSHPGTSEMGRLLSIEMFYTLVCVLLVMPSLLGTPKRRLLHRVPEA
ncbi:MAG: hopanoid biosynthesis-associated transporter HpnN [Rhodospirillales bacterium]|nr:hopanoid biosynthesis-associated transporter HpnN [Rhodospirillales bacterium]